MCKYTRSDRIRNGDIQDEVCGLYEDLDAGGEVVHPYEEGNHKYSNDKL